MANLNKYDKLHADNISAYERQIKEIYDTAIKEAAAIGASIDKFNPDKMFTFNDYPQTKKKINNLINKLNHNVNVSIGNGIKSGWDLSNAKNDMLVSNCFSKTNAKIFTSIKEMPGELQEAVKEYTEMLFHHVNRYLRDNKIINKSKHDRVLETIKGLDEAFSNTKLEKGTYYRGLQFLKKEDKEKYIEQLKKGDFTDKGYSSTTKKLEVAKDFAEGKNGVVLKINGEGLNLSGETFYEEEEVLINRNSKFKVDKIYEKEGVTYAELTQITQKQKLLSEKDKVRLFARNIEAQNAFMKRKVNGLSLSDRVWRYSKQFKGEIELALDIGIREGKSAAELSRDLRKYLQRPDDLFRRVRDEHGILRLSKRAASFHPGVGVYRSSYKNAMRLARTEINMAYRTADHLRWQQLDFVVGIEVRRSNRKYNCVVCESLAGKYPKDFKFTGWHPQCYSDDSYVLTNHGWKLFKDVEYTEKIFSLNPITKIPEWVGIEDMQKYYYVGEMVRFFSRRLDSLVTPDHEMIYIDESNNLQRKQAFEFNETDGAFYRGLKWKDNDIIPLFDKDFIQYNGYVYDLTLKKNHIMYIRRNGKCFWGSNCRCHAISILATEQELMESIETGKPIKSKNEVQGVPKNFNRWVEDNKDRIEKAKSKPYWMKDNKAYLDKISKLL